MIIADDKKEVIKGGLGTESAFKINTTSKAFHILSDGLYSDKIRAIVRELSCNAYDSHIAANKRDVPFTVHLPNHFEPWFAVRDEGVGLSDDQVKELYTTYFASTKTTSNDFIGALGLGSKSPFSYTKSFTVTSVFNGVRRQYSCFINEEDVPTLAPLTTEETNDPNGVEIRVPVRANDFGSFEQRARSVLAYFNPAPKIEGHPNFNIQKIEHVTEGTGWKLRKSEAGAYAIMGNIAYKIDPNSVTGLTAKQSSVLRSSFDLYFSIGEIEMAASRESLSYKPHTIEAIKKACDVVATEFNANINKEFELCENEWQARLKWSKFFQSHNRHYGYHNNQSYYHIDPHLYDIKWRGIKIDGTRFEITKLDSQFTGKVAYHEYSTGWGSGTRKNPLYKDYNGKSQIDVVESPIFIRNDLPNQTGTTRISAWMRNNNIRQAYFVEFTEESDAQKWETMMGLKFKLTSELPKVSKNKGPVKVLVFNGSYGSERSCWNEETLDTSNFTNLKGYYVDASGWNILRGEDDVTTSIRDMIKYAVTLGLVKLDANTKLIALRKAAKPDFEDDPNWVNFFDHVTEAAKKYFADPKVYEPLNEHIMFKKFRDRDQILRVFTHNIWDQKWFEKAPYSAHPLAEFITRLQKMHKTNSNTIDANIELAKMLGIELQTAANAYDFAGTWKEYTTKFPMLGLVARQNFYSQKSDMEIILDYVK